MGALEARRVASTRCRRASIFSLASKRAASCALVTLERRAASCAKGSMDKSACGADRCVGRRQQYTPEEMEARRLPTPHITRAEAPYCLRAANLPIVRPALRCPAIGGNMLQSSLTLNMGQPVPSGFLTQVFERHTPLRVSTPCAMRSWAPRLCGASSALSSPWSPGTRARLSCSHSPPGPAAFNVAEDGAKSSAL